MKKVAILTAMLAVALLCPGAQAYAGGPDEGLRLAEELYRKGMYDEARTLFEAEEAGPLADGYIVLCALKTGSVDYESLMGEYERKYGRTILTGAIRLENARLRPGKVRRGIPGVFQGGVILDSFC